MSITLHGFSLSGHSHRVQLALSLMGLPHQVVQVDLKHGAHKSPEFLKLNPFGQVPVLDDDGTTLFDSNAILVYLATKYDADRRWLPRDPKGQADVQAWLSVAAGLVAFGPAAARLITVFGARFNPEDVIGRAHGLLKVMDGLLATRHFLVGNNATLADIAGYSYIAAAPEGNVDLAAYPNVRAWLARVEALSGFVPFQKTPVGLAA
ncbi:Protein GstA [Rubrivivax sp. A210]|uniref:glutathione S-transferase family protein n=1 Tax=Rubrivivax sp. A210 TaxID=2772301 RepID=UPI0019180CD2|nr:glutathione S-transferase [Rubrivivax sp. A210]CAD5371776.1 Protein GstA [Rubrivivax sp. A210]